MKLNKLVAKVLTLAVTISVLVLPLQRRQQGNSHRLPLLRRIRLFLRTSTPASAMVIVFSVQ